MSSESSEGITPLIQSIVKSCNDISSRHREMSRSLRRLEQDISREQKQLAKGHLRVRKPTEQKPQRVSKEMHLFLEENRGDEQSVNGEWTRHQMQRIISRYIKEHELGLPDNKRQWRADNALTNALHIKSDTTYTYLDINSLITHTI